MALYWPDKKVALDIIDDPKRSPFVGDDSFTVLHVTLGELSTTEGLRHIKMSLLSALGTACVPEPMVASDKDDFDQATEAFVTRMLKLDRPMKVYHSEKHVEEFDSVQILARDEQEALEMTHNAEVQGQTVRGVTIWNGPVPDGSFYFVAPNVRMSTPEYFFLRKTNVLPLPLATSLGLELCGKFRTSATQYDINDTYDFLRNTRTTKARIAKYLRGASHTKEGKRSKRILTLISENCPSPASAWLYLMLCLPASYGGYGLPLPQLAKVYATTSGYLPPAGGPYIIYDLSWGKQSVALQYTGPRGTDTTLTAETMQGGIRVIPVTYEDMCDPKAMDKLATTLACRLMMRLPDRDERWIEARAQLRDQIKVPTYPRMRLTMDEICTHLGD